MATTTTAATKTVNFYDLLGVTKKSTPNEIKKNYHKLAKKWHPDKWSTSDKSRMKEAENKFKEINRAYETLSDPVKKNDYDLSLNNVNENITNVKHNHNYYRPQSTTSNYYYYYTYETEESKILFFECCLI